MNSVLIFYNNITYILRDEILKYTLLYIDDIPIRGPKTRYKLPKGGIEVLKQNLGIQ